MRSIIVFIILSLGCFSEAKFKAVVTEIVIDGESERTARTEAMDKASQEVTLEMIEAEIGATRVNENKSKINQDIQALKNRFIPYIKVVSSQKTTNEDGDPAFRFKVEMKVSHNDLRTILQQKGLYASQTKTGIVLPFVEVNNQISGESYRWWESVLSTSRDIENFSQNFEDELAQGFLEKGLFLLKPQSFQMVHMIPHFMRKSYLTETDKVQLSTLKKGQIFLDGRVDISSSPVKEGALRVRVQLSCKQVANGKSVAEVVKVFDSPKGQKFTQLSEEVKAVALETGEDLASQIYDLWQRGALEAEQIQLAVTGGLSHSQLERFKTALQQQLGAESLTERLFEPGQVTFEMDYSGGVESLKEKLRQGQIDGFRSQVVSSEGSQLTLKVQALE